MHVCAAVGSQFNGAEIKMDYLANLHSSTDNLFFRSHILIQFISEPIVLNKSYGEKLNVMTDVTCILAHLTASREILQSVKNQQHLE